MTGPASRRAFIGVAHGAGNDRLLLSHALEAKIDFVEADIWPRGHRVAAHHERRVAATPLLFEMWYLRLDSRPVWLDDIAVAASGRGVRVYADLKGRGRAFAARVLDVLRRGNALDGAILSGHHWAELAWARREAPIEVYPSAKNARQLARFWRFHDRHSGDIDGIAIGEALVTAEVVEACRSRGLRMLPWTVDDDERARQLIELGVDGLISNRVSLLREMCLWASHARGERRPSG